MFNLKPEAFGLDISDFSVRFAKLKKVKNNIAQLVSFGEEKIPKGIVEGGEIKSKSELCRIIKKAISCPNGQKLKINRVISSLPEEKSYIDVIQLPILSLKETENAIRHEAENHIPLPIDEVYLGWEKVESSFNQNKYQEVLIAAAPKNLVNDYISVLKGAGLEIFGLEIECLAIIRSLAGKREMPGHFLVIDFGGSRTTFIFYSGQSVRFTATIAFSSQYLSEGVSRKLNIALKDGEKLKIKNGLNGDKKIRDILNPELEKLAEEIKNCFEYYCTHEDKNHLLVSGAKPEKIFLCGEAANLKGLVDFLGKQLKLEVGLADSFSNISREPAKGVPKLNFNKSLAYTTALGLALRGI